jgi:hypothetical protein
MAAIDNLSWETNFLEYPSLRCTLNSAKFQFFWVHFKITKLQQLDLKYSLLATCNMWGLASGFIRMNICKRDKLKPYSILMRRCDSPGNSKISDLPQVNVCLKPWSPVETKAGDPVWTGKQTEQMFLFSKYVLWELDNLSLHIRKFRRICERCLSCLQLPTHTEVYCLLPQVHWP